jgi:hypothetical protein
VDQDFRRHICSFKPDEQPGLRHSVVLTSGDDLLILMTEAQRRICKARGFALEVDRSALGGNVRLRPSLVDVGSTLSVLPPQPRTS